MAVSSIEEFSRAPSAALRDLVTRYFERRVHFDQEVILTFPIRPDLFIDFHLTDYLRIRSSDGDPRAISSDVIVVAPHAGRLVTGHLTGTVHHFCIQLQPTALHRLLGIGMQQLTDLYVPAADLFGPSLHRLRDAVGVGQPLATLANPAFKLDVLTREAAIAGQLGTVSADDLGLEKGRLDRATQTAAAGYDLVKARRDLSVQQQLHDQGFVSEAGVATYREQADYQEKRLRQLSMGEASERDIAALQARRLRETRARLTGNLAAVEQSLDALVLRAPVAGRLTNFTVQPGQNLKPGDPAGQIDSEGRWKLIADVDEYYLGRVRVGQRAIADGGVRLTVAKVLPAVTDGRFRIELGFAGAVPPLNRGQALDVRVTLGAAHVATVAPNGAWLESGGGGSAFIVDAAGRHAARHAIRVGARNPQGVEILSGLRPGDRIVTSATDTIKGDALNIH